MSIYFNKLLSHYSNINFTPTSHTQFLLYLQNQNCLFQIK